MPEMKYSLLMNMILNKAEAFVKDNDSSAMSREYLLAAMLVVLQYDEDAAKLIEEDRSEYLLTRDLVLRKIKDPDAVEKLLRTWRGKQVSTSERLMLMNMKNRARDLAQDEGTVKLRAYQYAQAMLASATPMMTQLFAADEEEQSTTKPEAKPEMPAKRPSQEGENSTISWGSGLKEELKYPKKSDSPEEAQPRNTDGDAGPDDQGVVEKLVARTKRLQTELSQVVLGQSHAVSAFASGYFQAEMQCILEPERHKPKATFLFAGPPGVGKTFLSEQAAKRLGMPYMRFDMSDYGEADSVDDLLGYGANYKSPEPGKLTDFIQNNPRCVILFDEIEKAHRRVILLFLQILDAGHIRDKRHKQEVSFENAILIFTTNAGKKLYEDSESHSLSHMSRKVILDALGQDSNPITHEPLFPQAICSRFAAGNVVMFNHLPAHILRSIVNRQLTGHLDRMEKELHVSSDLDRNVVTALLLAEGASADARMVKSRADAFFGGELFELFRMASSARSTTAPGQIRRIHIDLQMPENDAEIASLFISSEPMQALVYSSRPVKLPDIPGRCLFTCCSNPEDARKALKKNEFHFILCVMDEEEGARKYLNYEDVESVSRDFLLETLEKNPELPVYLLEHKDGEFTDEEKESYYRRGVRGFISADVARMKTQLLEVLDMIHQQHSLNQLARSNRLISFETAQHIHEDNQTASIILFDLKLLTAVSAGDKGSIMSNLSRPDTKFSDVIGAEDAKSELKQFADFLRHPRKYMGRGIAAPKGILLYGPPGTGKTLMAKALAGETGVTFIAAEGNQFFSKWVGEGQEMVHKLFAAARRYAPSILFVDEIDTIARDRSSSGDAGTQSQEQILTAFFSEMDGFRTDPNRPVFVVGATNYGVDASQGKALDPAMLRRFDRQIYVDLPNKAERAQFLRMRRDQNPAFEKVTDEMIQAISERTTGMSLALLSNVLELALRNAMKNGAVQVDDACLDEALESYNNGEKKKWGAEITLRTARHEAGHTLISWMGGEKPSYVTIVSRADHGGYMQHEDGEARMGYTRQELLSRIRTALGGRAAELVCYGKEDGLSTGASSDLQSATSIASNMLGRYGMNEDFGMATMTGQGTDTLQSQLRNRVNDILRAELDTAVSLIGKNRDALDALVNVLLEKNHLNGPDIDKLLSRMIK